MIIITIHTFIFHLILFIIIFFFLHTLYQIALCHRRLNNITEAIRSYKYALTVTKGFPCDDKNQILLVAEILEPIITLYRKKNMFDQAFHHCLELLSLFDKKGAFHLSLSPYICIYIHACNYVRTYIHTYMHTNIYGNILINNHQHTTH